MRLTPTLCVLALLITACGGPETIGDRQAWLLRDVKEHVKKSGYDLDGVEILYDDHNNAWRDFWSGIELTAEAQKWQTNLHTVWVYKVVPRTDTDRRVLWVFVDRKTGVIKGDYEDRG